MKVRFSVRVPPSLHPQHPLEKKEKKKTWLERHMPELRSVSPAPPPTNRLRMNKNYLFIPVTCTLQGLGRFSVASLSEKAQSKNEFSQFRRSREESVTSIILQSQFFLEKDFKKPRKFWAQRKRYYCCFHSVLLWSVHSHRIVWKSIQTVPIIIPLCQRYTKSDENIHQKASHLRTAYWSPAVGR